MYSKTTILHIPHTHTHTHRHCFSVFRQGDVLVAYISVVHDDFCLNLVSIHVHVLSGSYFLVNGVIRHLYGTLQKKKKKNYIIGDWLECW
jgi:hypothetical protein